MILSNTQLNTLEALKTFRYLTTKQLVKIGIAQTEKSIRDKILPRLRVKPYPLIKSADFGFVAGVGRLPQLHYLTKRGALALADLHGVGLDQIPYPIGTIQFSRDYFHRVAFIDLHIALEQYAQQTEQTVCFFHSYFDSSGNQRQANSQLVRDTQVRLNNETIIPDGNFMLKMQDGEKRLFTLELHRGNNTKRIIQQLETHARLIENECLPEKYKHPYDNYVLSVYDHQGTQHAVQRRFLENKRLNAFQAHFGFNHLDHLQADFSQLWQYANKQAFSVFPNNKLL